jgi:hypothetical protein
MHRGSEEMKASQKASYRIVGMRLLTPEVSLFHKDVPSLRIRARSYGCRREDHLTTFALTAPPSVLIVTCSDRIFPADALWMNEASHFHLSL